ncbi:PDT-domain-containing protein [Rickenella mellea]|uniref:prephenate dehydratase n=1 Tax=Rickenella mellea TaxID=50990 RepID=A0A4Y7QMM3_9AGAM|nr:PDT-domain-containing protein [Rickenella mellea]
MHLEAEPQKPSLAFLGPEGTYSHQAAHDHFGDSVHYIKVDSINDAVYSLSPQIPFAIVPAENSIFGSVVETLDCFRHKSVGQTCFIRGETTFAIRHCLLVKKGVKLQNVKTVLSHEQALGQCKTFLERYLPLASVIKTSSTAEAARMLADPTNVDASTSAAICSKLCADLYPVLDVLQEGIQNAETNLTRFWFLAWSMYSLPPSNPQVERHSLTALLRISPSPSSLLGCPSVGVARVLQLLQMRMARIDRRPALLNPPFTDIYFLEVEEISESDSRDRPRAVQDWKDRIEGKAQSVRSLGYGCISIGIW